MRHNRQCHVLLVSSVLLQVVLPFPISPDWNTTGVVIGETAEIGSNVSIFQGVTLGGKGNEAGDRHPKIKSGASIYASSTLLGNITIGENSVVAAGSLVLKDVEPNVTVAGIPAKIIS